MEKHKIVPHDNKKNNKKEEERTQYDKPKIVTQKI
jgi:hypothetical protein